MTASIFHFPLSVLLQNLVFNSRNDIISLYSWCNDCLLTITDYSLLCISLFKHSYTVTSEVEYPGITNNHHKYHSNERVKHSDLLETTSTPQLDTHQTLIPPDNPQLSSNYGM